MSRDIKDVPTEELEADLQRNPVPALRKRIEAELKGRPAPQSTQQPTPSPQPSPNPQAAQQPGFLDNLKTSGMNFLTDTAVGLGDQAQFMQNLFFNPGQAQVQAQGYMDAMSGIGDYASQRYGSLGQLGETAYNDPIGTAADFGAAGAALMTGGKVLGPLAARAGKVPGALAKSVEDGGRVMSNLDPITGLTTAGQVALAPSNVARFIGSEYTKGSDIKNTPDLEQGIQSMLDADYTPDVEGRNRWAADRDQAGADVDAAYSMADAEVAAGIQSSPFTAARLRERLSAQAPEVTADRAAWDRGVDAAMEAFEGELSRLGTDSMSPSQMREFKQTLDKAITDATREGTSTAINPQVKNAVANATRDLINTQFPDVASANANFSRLQGMSKSMEKTGMSDITDFSRVELSANMVVDAARRLTTGESKVARARGYQALRTGDYTGYLFDHSGAKSLMTLPRQQGALEERLDRSRQYTVGILED